MRGNSQMKHENRIFKIGMFIALGAEISILWGIIFEALREFDPSHVETIGLAAAILSAVVASSVLLISLVLILKWKG
jgi:hypothetical protein